MKNIKRCLIVVLILLINMPRVVFGEQYDDLLKDIDMINKQIEGTNSELAGTKAQMTEQLTQINHLNSEISVVEDEISTLQSQITSLEVQIFEKDSSIKEQEERYAIQKELLDKRLVALYESGNMSYLDMLLQADGLADFISKYYTIEILAQSDEELLAKIDATRNQIISEKADLENLRKEIQTSKTAVEGKKSELASSVSKKQTIVANLSAEEKELQEQLEIFEQHKKEIQYEIDRIASKEKKYNYLTPSDAGYIFPVKGCSLANINNKNYPSYTGHTGVDVNINVSNKEVVAVKDGTIEISTAKIINGKYVSYGEYVVINHHDGTMTLYAHMKSGSRRVIAGQQVKQGDIIGLVGSTGNSTGDHLHFEVRIDGKPVNPIPYL
mgnify:CR=1 FL=1